MSKTNHLELFKSVFSDGMWGGHTTPPQLVSWNMVKCKIHLWVKKTNFLNFQSVINNLVNTSKKIINIKNQKKINFVSTFGRFKIHKF